MASSDIANIDLTPESLAQLMADDPIAAIETMVTRLDSVLVAPATLKITRFRKNVQTLERMLEARMGMEEAAREIAVTPRQDGGYDARCSACPWSDTRPSEVEALKAGTEHKRLYIDPNGEPWDFAGEPGEWKVADPDGLRDALRKAEIDEDDITRALPKKVVPDHRILTELAKRAKLWAIITDFRERKWGPPHLVKREAK